MSAYATLLRLREIEEKQAEMEFAQAHRELTECERDVEGTRRARHAWLDELAEGSRAREDSAELAGLVIRLETVERDAELRLEEATRRQDARRDALVEAQRRRQTVENLHRAALEARAREAARREQLELDDLARMGAAARTEIR